MPSEIPSSVSGRPYVLLLSLDYNGYPWFDDMYDRLITKLLNHARLQHAKEKGAALSYLNNGHPAAVFVTDPGIANHMNNDVLNMIKEYVTEGGTVIFGGLFASSIQPNDMHQFFRRGFGLSWEPGAYHRTTVHLNQNVARTLDSTRRLRPAYSQKAVFLRNVEHLSALYLPSTDSVTESHVFGPTPVADLSQTPVVWHQLGNGFIGYIGDVNAEEGTDEVALAMCGF
ncbi:hypothetical protein FQN54_009337 [Arachnomyces sp. PD_36]|nr:hypothetical protein FQN54_009337 [Arachnomyces sp. PD_36]